MCAAAFLLAGAGAGTGGAETVNIFQTGGWQGCANYQSDGTFTHCGITGRRGTSGLLIGIGGDGMVVIAIGDSSWNLEAER